MIRRWMGIGAGVLLLFLLLFGGKVYFGSLEEFRKGEESLARGDFQVALMHYERAVHWHIPGMPSGKRSLERVWEIGQKMEEKGAKEKALGAYWTLRNSLYGVRSFYTPEKTWIERADERIAVLWTESEPHSAEEKKMSPGQRKAHYLHLLKKDWAPKVGWAMAAVGGFFGWVGCVLAFIFSFRRPGGAMHGRKALIWGGGALFFYFLWILGMVRA
jgi:hypothetical protein